MSVWKIVDMTVWGRNRAEALQFLMDNIGIVDNGYWDHRGLEHTAPNTWWVVDYSTSDESVGYPGDMIAECWSLEAARSERAIFILHEVDRTVNFHNTTGGSRYV